MSSDRGTQLDINCDLGEIDPSLELERNIMPFIDRCNIACGGHAGDKESIRSCLEMTKEYDVLAGAHPSFLDRENFGRKLLSINLDTLASQLKDQLDLFFSQANMLEIKIDHVKAHGALYHYVGFDQKAADMFLQVLEAYDPKIKVLGPPNSELELASKTRGRVYLKEGFADRRYLTNGKLQSRTIIGSVLHEPKKVVEQVSQIFQSQKVKTADGQFIPMIVDSICVHGDHKNSIPIVQAIRSSML